MVLANLCLRGSTSYVCYIRSRSTKQIDGVEDKSCAEPYAHPRKKARRSQLRSREYSQDVDNMNSGSARMVEQMRWRERTCFSEEQHAACENYYNNEVS